MKNGPNGVSLSRALLAIVAVGLVYFAFKQWYPINTDQTESALQSSDLIDERPTEGATKELPAKVIPNPNATTPLPIGSPNVQLATDHRDPRLAPNSLEEAHWLKTHGYPDQLEREALESYSEDVLRTKAKAGDLLAKVELAKRLAQRDSGTEPLQLLLDAATAGSLHAVVTLGDIHAHASESYRNPVLASSYYIAAGMLGDFGAIAASNWFVASKFDTARQRAALMLAAQFIQNLQEQRRLTSGGVPVIEPRPGFTDVTNTIIESLDHPNTNQNGGG